MKFTGKTKAYNRFAEHYWRTEELLNAAISGLEENRKPLESVLSKFEDVKSPKGRPPKNHKPSINSKKTKDGNGIELSMDDRSAALMKKVIEDRLQKHKDLTYHHHSILAVSIWGSYETYIYMLFQGLFKKQPNMLKTNESVAFKDALENKNDIVMYLSELSLEKIGNFNLKDSMSYVSDKINFKYSSQREKKLHEIYLIRNIIAHNSGILRPGQEKKIPKEIAVKNNELRITSTYLKRIHSTIKASVDILDKHVVNKFYK